MKLKECPFCGGEAEIIEHYFVVDNSYTFGVGCKECNAVTYNFFQTKEEAVKSWNSRSNDNES